MHSEVLGAPINDDIPLENNIIKSENVNPIAKNTIMAILNIFLASKSRPLERLLDTIIESATGKPDVERTYK